MRLTLITEPTVEPVTLAEVKAHLNERSADHDTLITGLIRTAVQHLDGRTGRLGRCLITQRWRAELESFPAQIVLPLPPCQSVEGITYRAVNGTAHELDPSTYIVAGLHQEWPAVVSRYRAGQWPATSRGLDAVSITFRAGYGDTPDKVPEPIRQAIKMQVAHLFENREAASSTDGGFIRATPLGFEDQITGFREWAF